MVDNTQSTSNYKKICFKKRSELSVVDTRHVDGEVEYQSQDDDDDEDNDNSLIVAMYVRLCACVCMHVCVISLSRIYYCD